MRYYENTAEGCILSFGAADYGGKEISEERYNAIAEAMKNTPKETESVGYRLKTNLTWESYEIEPVDPDITDGEAFAIIFGGGE